MKTLYRNLLLGFLILLTPCLTKGQGQANIWYFGNGNGLDFNYTPPVVLENGNVNLGALNFEGVGSICDNNGVLLFYTDGIEVFDKNHNEMPSTVTANLLGGDGSSTQSGLILPVNGSTTQYFIVSTDNSTDRSYYSVVDMTLNGGLGDVVAASKNSSLVTSGCSEGVVAIPEYDATNNPTGESWIVFHDHSTNNFRVYKTSGATMSFSASYAVGFTPAQRALILKTNACFDKIAISYYNYGRVEVLPFNNQTGVILAPSLILTGTGAGNPFLNVEVYGLEFSTNDQFLYVSESGLNSRRTIYQFNIGGASGTNPAAVLASRSYFTGTTTSRFGHVQLGPDGKIYVPAFNFSGVTYMSCIPTPNVAWTTPTPTATEFQYLLYTYNYTGARTVGEGLPVFSQALLRQIKIFVTNACEAEPANFSYTFGGAAVSQTWNFGDPGSGVLNTSNNIAPSHTYSLAGTYTVTLTVTDNCGRIRTASANVIIKPGPVVSVPTNACINQNVTLTGTGVNAASYIWSSSPTMTPVLTTGNTYTYNGSLPYTVYVKDPTPIANYTVGNSTASQTAGADVGHTYFELLTSVTLTQFQVIARLNGQNATFTLQNEAGTTNYWSQAAPLSVAATTYTFNPNVTLAPGRYRIFTSNVDYAFRNNTTNDGGRDVPGVVDVLGEKNGAKGGEFINLKFALPDPCGVRAYTITENCIMPVGWLSFTARAEGESVGLWWNVSFEKDNSYFVVQRSTDGINFSDIGIVNGRGNATTAASYSFTDEEPSTTNYYRLKQVDINGAFTYSTIATVQFNGVSVWAAPNPFYQELTLTFTSDEAASIEVIDMTGQSVAAYYKTQGDNSFVLGTGLPAGAYLIKVVSASQAKTIPVIKSN